MLQIVLNIGRNRETMTNQEKSWKELFYEKRSSEYRQKAYEAGEMKKPNFDDTNVYHYVKRDIRILTGFADVLNEYDIMENSDYELMFIISPNVSLQGDYDKAFLFTDGDEHAILVKGPYCIYICDYVNEAVRHKLIGQKEILFVELDESTNIEKEYMAKVIHFEDTSELANQIMRVKWNKGSRYAITSV